MTASSATIAPLQRLLSRHRRSRALGLLVMAAVFATAPLWLSAADEYTAGLAVVAVLLALSYNLLLGSTGMVSFGHAAFYGIGAYTVALFATKTSLSPLLGLAVSPLIGAVSGFVIGLICLRAVRLYFALLTLAVSQLLYVLAFEWDTLTGGDNGIHGIPVPDWLVDPNNLYYFVLAVVVVGALLLWLISASPFGAALNAIRENRQRSAFIGLRVKAYELAAFSIGCSLATVAGALYAVYDQQAFPGLMFWTEAATPIVMVLIGGLRSFWGPVFGAVLYTVLASRVRSSTNYWDLLIGAIVLALVLLLPDGLAGVPRRLGQAWHAITGRRRPGSASVAADAGVLMALAPIEAALRTPPPRRGETAALLRVRGLGKRVGGLVAVHDVDLDVLPGTVHALIGPNGAGKSTLFNLVSGLLRPDTGTVHFDGEDVTGAAAPRLARLGIGRGFQTTSIFPFLTVAESVRVACLAITGGTRRPLPPTRRLHRERVDHLLEGVGLSGLADVPARELSHGDQRALELAISLALDARLLLLDEPTAGMSPYETQRTLSLLRRITEDRGLTVLLVEHDMAVVFGVSEHVTVMAEGTVLAEGNPEEVRRNPEVIRAYLGDESEEWSA